MHSAAIAEWILSRFTSNERAASIVGDLVEIGERKGALWFWLALCGVVLSLVWRRPFAFIAAFYAGGWTISLFTMANCSIYSLHCASGLWYRAFGPLIVITSTLWTLFSYTAIRYSVLDRMTQMTFVWAGLFTIAIYFWWQPVVLGLCIAAALLVVVACIFRSSLRRDALVLVMSIVVGAAARFFAVIVVGFYQEYLGRRLHILWGGREVREHPSLLWVYLCTVVLSLLVATWVWSRMYHWLAQQRSEAEANGQST